MLQHFVGGVAQSSLLLNGIGVQYLKLTVYSMNHLAQIRQLLKTDAAVKFCLESTHLERMSCADS